MYQGLYSIVSGGKASHERLDILANNLANAATVGYKADRPIFRVIYQSSEGGVQPPAAGVSDPSPPSFRPEGSAYLELNGIKTDFSQGELKSTRQPLDLAILGKGLFVIDTLEGLRFTRKGNFTLNGDGYLVTTDGHMVMGERGHIRLLGRNIMVDGDGGIAEDGVPADALRVVDFPDPSALQKAGNSLFAPKNPEVRMERAAGFEIKQGYLEQSNVSVVKMLVEMIEIARSYEAYQKVMNNLIGERGISSRSINDVGKI